jgi:hypothetical protein
MDIDHFIMDSNHDIIDLMHQYESYKLAYDHINHNLHPMQNEKVIK